MVVTIPFNHATKEGNIFFIGSLNRNSDCTSTIMSEHTTLKKTAHSLRPRQVILTPFQHSIDRVRKKNILFIHLETQYAKTECKNEIYVKHWVRRTWTEKVNGQSQRKSTVWSTSWSTMMSADWRVTSIDDMAVITSPRANVSRRKPGARKRVPSRTVTRRGA